MNKGEYYEKLLLENQKRAANTLSYKLIYLFFLSLKDKTTELKKRVLHLLKDIKVFIKDENQTLDPQSYLDFWYYTKLLGFGDLFKPPNKFLTELVHSIREGCGDKDPVEAVFHYIYIRILLECDYEEYSSLSLYIEGLELITHQDAVYYGYYLTHIVLYDLKFGLKNHKPLLPETTQDAIQKLVALCETHSDIINDENVDLLTEIMLCFTLCGVRPETLYSQILNILEEPQDISDNHLVTVLASYYMLKCNYE